MKVLLGLGFAMGMMGSAGAAEDYGAAGCGLGSIVFGKEGKMQQILASTTNGTFGSQTFGITSGTSNCEKGGKLAALPVKEFAASNRNQLEAEVAQGSGETIASISNLMNCSNEAAVATSLKSNFNEIFDESSNDEVGAKVADQLASDAQFQQACQG